MLICGENTNPLARYTMIAQAEQVHIASYPPIWPTHDPSAGGNYDLAHAIRLRAGAHSFEGKVFTIVASGSMDRAMFQVLSQLDADAARILENSPRSVSLFTGPSGATIGDELCDEEGLLYADIDVAQCIAPKQFHDISGGYNRFDIFHLTVNRAANRPVTFLSGDEAKEVEAGDTADVEAEDEM
jgi:aliphatic nitrilase